MKRAIGETDRRRAQAGRLQRRRTASRRKGVQQAHQGHHRRRLRLDEARRSCKAAQDEARYEAMSEKQIAREIEALEKEMLEHAKNLEFEKAAAARDRLSELKKKVFGIEA